MFLPRRGFINPAVIIILAIITISVAAIIYFNSRLISDVKENNPTTQNQTTSPSPSNNSSPKVTVTDEMISYDKETANWKTYTNSKFRYSFKYPPTIKLNEFEEDHLGLTGQISIIVDKSNPEDCRGDCPYEIYVSDEKIGSYPVRKIIGEIGGIGGATPQHYHEVIFYNNGYYYTFILYELDEEHDTGDMERLPGHFDQEDLKTFNQILSTFKFLD